MHKEGTARFVKKRKGTLLREEKKDFSPRLSKKDSVFETVEKTGERVNRQEKVRLPKGGPNSLRRRGKTSTAAEVYTSGHRGRVNITSLCPGGERILESEEKRSPSAGIKKKKGIILKTRDRPAPVSRDSHL